MPPEERIATFDQDGTLWVEQPMYTQVMYCLERVPTCRGEARTGEHRALQHCPGAAHGDRAAMAKLTLPDLEKNLVATLTGMSVEDISYRGEEWLAPQDPRWKRPYTELTYQPMQEVLRYLRANGYKTYIVTGGGQDFVRAYAEQDLRRPARAGRRHRAPGRSMAMTRMASRPHQGTQARC